jgi:hypothetical protein
MKKILLSLLVFTALSVCAFSLTTADNNRVTGAYSVRLTGHIFDPANGFVPVAIVGQITISGNTAQGSRILTMAGANQNPVPASFNCTITEGENGTGTLACTVNEFNSPGLQRIDTFSMVVTEKGKKIELLFLNGQPVPGSPLPAITGVSISGTAIKQ